MKMKEFKKKGFLVLILSVSLFSCNNSLTRNYVDLNKDEVLIVKNNDIRYTNTTVSITSDVVITYDVKRDYTLNRNFQSLGMPSRRSPYTASCRSMPASSQSIRPRPSSALSFL